MITAEEKVLVVDNPLKAKKDLKCLFVTLPQRDTPGTFPPYGPLAVMTYLKKSGYINLGLYNMDLLRPEREKAIEHVVACNPGVLCISAPVSTAYENCKYFSLEIKKRLPNLLIVLGGNLAASAEIILRKTGVDICVLGEGEIACRKLFDHLAESKPRAELYRIPGLGFLDEKGNFVNTGHAEQLPMEEVYDVDWDIWDEFSWKYCFRQLKEVDQDSPYIRYYTGVWSGVSAEQLEKRIGIIVGSKGCVARCTFCHRWQKGIRFIPPEICVERIKEMMKRFEVGVLNIADECFGADIKWLHKFCELMKPLGLIWKVGGMRVKQITREIIAMMKDAGCRSIIYGMETGSERMIEVMEKRASVEDNIRAFQLTLEAGLYTIPQLILGMPGETPETINESADFISRNMVLDRSQNPREVSINFAQALPGTPLYEYARHKGLIGESLEEEEQYLLHISDRNACDEETTLNFTEYPRLTLISWRNIILVTLKYRYAVTFGMAHYYKIMFPQGRPSFWTMIKNKSFGHMLDNYPRLTYRLRHWMWLLKFVNIWNKRGPKIALGMLREFIVMNIRRSWKKVSRFEYKSLRRTMEKDVPDAFKGTEAMVPLRKGR